MLGASLLVTGLCAIGIKNVVVETDPVRLWVPPDSDVFNDKSDFDNMFEPFYRVEQLIITSTNPKRSIIEPSNLMAVRNLQRNITSLVARYGKENVTFDSLCSRPIPGRWCLVESATQYWESKTQSPMRKVSARPLFVLLLNCCCSATQPLEVATLSDVQNWLRKCTTDIVRARSFAAACSV